MKELIGPVVLLGIIIFSFSLLISSMVRDKTAEHEAEQRAIEFGKRRSELVGRCHGEKRAPIITADRDVLCVDPAGIVWRKAP